MKNKKHYYDGYFYEKLIDPALKEVRELISKRISKGSKIIDIGCGTGALVFYLSKKCHTAIGVELSSKMVTHAKKRKKEIGLTNTNFIQADATKLTEFPDKSFDYATISMMLHEIPQELRTKVLMEAKRIAKKVIIADYKVPQPFNLYGLGVVIIEFLAGIDHFRNFMNFKKHNGVKGLLEKCQLSMKSKQLNKKGTIVVVEVS